MNPITEEWVQKAEGDFATMQREFAVTGRPNYDAVCFHAQQCVEKYLKGRMQEAQIAFPKTHNLPVLLDMVLQIEPQWAAFADDLADLNAHGVAVRYPGEYATREMAAEALQRCARFRAAARRALGVQERA